MDLKFNAELLNRCLIAVAEVGLGLILGPLVKRIIVSISHKVWDKGAMTFIGSFANIAIDVIAVIIAMDTVGINTNVLVGAFSALGLGISLALKDNMSNVAGGLQILITRPFRIGDFVSVGSHKGYVKSIELMYTTLETFSNKEVIVPNAKMISKILVNYSANPIRRVDLNVPVFKFMDIKETEDKLKKLIDEDKRILKDPEPTITVVKMRHQFVDIAVYVYTAYADYWPVFYDLSNQIATEVLENIPAPKPEASK